MVRSPPPTFAGRYISTFRWTECESAHAAQAARAAYRSATVGKKTYWSNQAVIAQTLCDWMWRREKLETKSASEITETAPASQPGRPASAASATTHSQYCGEKTLLARKKTHIRPQEARRTSSRRVPSSTLARTSAAASVTAAEIWLAWVTNERGLTPA